MFERVVEPGRHGAMRGREAVVNYAEMAERSMARYRGFLNGLETLKVGTRYLEVGPGPGILTVAVAQEKPDVQIAGVEISPDMVSVGKEYVERAGLADRIEFVVGDAEDRDALESLGQFDLVYSTFSLHHWQDPKKVIRNLMSVLADGGVLYIYDLRRVWWLYWVPIRSGFWDSVRAAYVAREMREMFREMGVERYQVKNEFPIMQSILISK